MSRMHEQSGLGSIEVPERFPVDRRRRGRLLSLTIHAARDMLDAAVVSVPPRTCAAAQRRRVRGVSSLPPRANSAAAPSCATGPAMCHRRGACTLSPARSTRGPPRFSPWRRFRSHKIPHQSRPAKALQSALLASHRGAPCVCVGVIHHELDGALACAGDEGGDDKPF